MRLQSSIALGALTVALAAMPGAALAKTAHHAKHKAAAEPVEGQLTTAEQLTMAQQQIAQLQAQLNALASRIDGSAVLVAQARRITTRCPVAVVNTLPSRTTPARNQPSSHCAADASAASSQGEKKRPKAVGTVAWIILAPLRLARARRSLP